MCKGNDSKVVLEAVISCGLYVFKAYEYEWMHVLQDEETNCGE